MRQAATPPATTVQGLEMFSKIIAASARPAGASAAIRLTNTVLHQRSQRGASLVELMVGIAIGLLVVAVAGGALMVSRGISGTVSDASVIQQQGAYAMRTIGLQLRQAGSLRLNLNPNTAAASDPYLVSVAFETDVAVASSPAMTSFMPKTDTLSGVASPVQLSAGYRRYTEPTFNGTAEITQSRNCVGGPADSGTPATHEKVESTFTLDAATHSLRCSGNGEAAQPIVRNVADFQVRYLVQDNAISGLSKIQTVDASAVANWGQVQAVEVCLVLYGDEAIGMAAGSNYTACDGTTQVDMSTLTGERARRMHVAFRNVFQLRSQGLLGSVL